MNASFSRIFHLLFLSSIFKHSSQFGSSPCILTLLDNKTSRSFTWPWCPPECPPVLVCTFLSPTGSYCVQLWHLWSLQVRSLNLASIPNHSSETASSSVTLGYDYYQSKGFSPWSPYTTSPGLFQQVVSFITEDILGLCCLTPLTSLLAPFLPLGFLQIFVLGSSCL